MGLRHFRELLTDSGLALLALKNDLILMTVPTVFALTISPGLAQPSQRAIMLVTGRAMPEA